MVPQPARSLLALTLFGVATLGAVAKASEPTIPAGWVSCPIPEASDRKSQLVCTNHSWDDWLVSTAAGPLEISRRDPRRPIATLPFEPPPTADENDRDWTTPSAVQAVRGGFLVGYDSGQFSGLYFFSVDGRKHVRISPSAGARSDWFPENVQAIAEYEGSFFVFQGSSYLDARRGRVLKVSPPEKGWRFTLLVDLGVAPEVVLQEKPGVWLMASKDGVSRITASGTVRRLWGRADILAGHQPNSIARGTDGRVYVGMRTWVLRLMPLRSETRWRADFLAPASRIRWQVKAE